MISASTHGTICIHDGLEIKLAMPVQRTAGQPDGTHQSTDILALNPWDSVAPAPAPIGEGVGNDVFDKPRN
jgi:hypothetical protein